MYCMKLYKELSANLTLSITIGFLANGFLIGLSTGTAVSVNTSIDLKLYGIHWYSQRCTDIPLQGVLLYNQ